MHSCNIYYLVIFERESQTLSLIKVSNKGKHVNIKLFPVVPSSAGRTRNAIEFSLLVLSI